MMKGEGEGDEIHGDKADMNESRERGKNVRMNEKRVSEIGVRGPRRWGERGEWCWERMNGNLGDKKKPGQNRKMRYERKNKRRILGAKDEWSSGVEKD